MRVSYIITDNNITVNYDGQTHIVPRKDALAGRLIDAIKTKNLEEIPRLVSVAKRVEEYGRGNFKVADGRVMINGVAAPDLLSRKIIRFMNEGLPFEPLVRFGENLLKNPSFRAVNELFQFLEKNDHPITENGCFIAYKKVRNDFKDGYTGTIDNSPGLTVEIPRNQVNEDPTQTCSHGLHVANWHYAKNIYSAGEDPRMLEVEVNPADVVAVPVDYDQAKMRVSRYVVLTEVDREHSSDVALRTVLADEPADSCEPDCCHHDEEEETEDDCCECGNPSCDGLCNDEDDVELCTECGAELSMFEDDICDECVAEQENEVEEEEEEEEEDRYPWEDELDEE